jgi:hypothetical protein
MIALSFSALKRTSDFDTETHFGLYLAHNPLRPILRSPVKYMGCNAISSTPCLGHGNQAQVAPYLRLFFLGCRLPAELYVWYRPPSQTWLVHLISSHSLHMIGTSRSQCAEDRAKFFPTYKNRVRTKYVDRLLVHPSSGNRMGIMLLFYYTTSSPSRGSAWRGLHFYFGHQ